MDKGSERMVAMTEGAIGWMIFNHPARHNAVSMAMWQGGGRLSEGFKADPAVRAIIVTGAGERAFVSGADISEFGEKRATPAAIAEYDAVGERASQLLEAVAKPTIAMIRGYCIGGGVDFGLRWCFCNPPPAAAVVAPAPAPRPRLPFLHWVPRSGGVGAA